MRARLVRWMLALSLAALAMSAVLVQAARAREVAGAAPGKDVAARPGGFEARR